MQTAPALGERASPRRCDGRSPLPLARWRHERAPITSRRRRRRRGRRAMSAASPGIQPFGADVTPQGPPRWLAAVAGVLSILVGIAALVWPGPTLLAVGLLFGIYFVIWAIGILVRAVGTGDVPVGLRVLDVVVGVIALFVGLGLVVRPGASVATAALILGF